MVELQALTYSQQKQSHRWVWTDNHSVFLSLLLEFLFKFVCSIKKQIPYVLYLTKCCSLYFRVFYRCFEGKKAGQRWCGNVPWTAVRYSNNSNNGNDFIFLSWGFD